MQLTNLLEDLHELALSATTRLEAHTLAVAYQDGINVLAPITSIAVTVQRASEQQTDPRRANRLALLSATFLDWVQEQASEEIAARAKHVAEDEGWQEFLRGQQGKGVK